MNSIGSRLKMLRNEAQKTQIELAEDFNYKYNYQFGKSIISQYENGKKQPSLGVLADLADYFDVSTDYLLGKTNKRKYDTDTLAFNVDPKLDTDGLSDEDYAVVQATIDALRKKNR